MSGTSDAKHSERRTEQQLETAQAGIDFLKSELDLCFTFASLTDTRLQIGDHEAAEQSLADAQKGYATLTRFLHDPKHSQHIDGQSLAEISERTEKLRSAIESVEARMSKRTG